MSPIDYHEGSSSQTSPKLRDAAIERATTTQRPNLKTVPAYFSMESLESLPPQGMPQVAAQVYLWLLPVSALAFGTQTRMGRVGLEYPPLGCWDAVNGQQVARAGETNEKAQSSRLGRYRAAS